MSRRISLIHLFAMAFAAGAAAQDGKPVERFTAFAVSNSNVVTAATPVQITVDRWSTSRERDRFVALLRDKGPEALLDAFRESPRVGTIRTPDSLGYPLHYAFETKDDKGERRIVIATDRPIGFWEQWNQPRTIEYPFTVIQLQIEGDGRGRGTMSYATKITARGDVIELEDFANAPIMLNDVRSNK